MANELAIIGENWLELGGGNKLPVPFAQEIFLQDCHVAGMMHVDDILVKTASLSQGSQLVMKRDPANAYDELAIALETAAGERVGWIPRKYNRPYARLMDAGKLLVAKVTHKELENHWLNLRIGIYLKDI